MGMNNCSGAGTCSCSCVRQDDESCQRAKRGQGRHCNRHADGCHEDCTEPPAKRSDAGRPRKR